MYVIEHALLNLGKNKGRNILLGGIILAIITATVVALAIYNTSQAVVAETRSALQCAVRVAPQRRAVSAGGAATPGGGTGEAVLSLDRYRAFAESDYLDGADIRESSRGVDGVDAVYYLKRPDMLGAFEAELRSKGLPDDYVARTDESAFAGVAGPVESLRRISLAFLLIVLALGAAIMVLLSFVAIRERKYEIGVLRAMGMKKDKVALGLWTEVLAITSICFVLGLGIGSALSQPISNAILRGQARATATGSTTLADRLSGGSAGKADQMDVAVSGMTVMEIFGISILLASVSGILSVSRITRFEPIKILNERD